MRQERLTYQRGGHSGSVASIRATGTLTCNQHLTNSWKSEGSISPVLVKS